MTRSCYWGFRGKQWVRRGEYLSEYGGEVWIILDGFGLWHGLWLPGARSWVIWGMGNRLGDGRVGLLMKDIFPMLSVRIAWSGEGHPLLDQPTSSDIVTL